MNVMQRMGLWFKAAATSTAMRFGTASRWGFSWLGSTSLDIRGKVGDGSRNSIVVACRNWAERTWPEAPLIVERLNAKGKWELAPDHALATLLKRPNPYYSGLQLVMATVSDRMLTGNAYWRKVRTANGRVVQLWWIPSWMIEPKWPDNDPTVFIGWYDYTVDGQVEQIATEDIVHFRRGFDSGNMRKGRNDLAYLLGEIFTDEEASSYVAAVLANMGVPGVIISPDGPAGGSPQNDDLEQIKEKFSERFGGDRRGQPMVMGTPTKVQILSFSPEQMTVRDLRRIPEERVTAVLGIPAIVAGLGAGLDRATYNNVAEAREAAYESHIIPDHRLFDADLDSQLIPDFGDPNRLRIGHDYKQVRVLQDDQNALHERARADLSAGLLTLNQALGMIGEEPLTGPEGDVRYVPNTLTIKTLDTLIPDPVLAQPIPQPALPAPADQPPSEPSKALVGAGSRNGHQNGKAALGVTLSLSDADLERLAQVKARDVAASERFWRTVTDGSGLEDLLDAGSEGDE